MWTSRLYMLGRNWTIWCERRSKVDGERNRTIWCERRFDVHVGAYTNGRWRANGEANGVDQTCRWCRPQNSMNCIDFQTVLSILRSWCDGSPSFGDFVSFVRCCLIPPVPALCQCNCISTWFCSHSLYLLTITSASRLLIIFSGAISNESLLELRFVSLGWIWCKFIHFKLL